MALPPPAFFGVNLVQVQKTCSCGGKYWPAQKWIHEKCGVVNHQETVTTATDPVDSVVVNAPKKRNRKATQFRSADRHKPSEARRQYVNQKMREYRARKRSAPGAS